MNCPNCGAPMHLGAGTEFQTCEYCKSTYIPEQNGEGVRMLGEVSDLACPLCSQPLAHAAINGQRVLYCQDCRGLLLHMDVFVALVDGIHAHSARPAVLQAPDPQGLKRRVACPQCHRPMDTHFYCGPGNIIIDDCSPCHLNWLDFGELSRVLRAAERA